MPIRKNLATGASMKGKKILVTGASGFVGSALALQLCQDGNAVYGLARFRDMEVRRQLESVGVHIVQRDIHRESIDDLPSDFDYVFSELAMLRNCDENQAEAFDVNTYFVGRLMRHCRGASGVVLASTGAVYLPGTYPWNEEGTIGPRNTYSVSKFGGEVLGRFLSELWQIPTCILRYYYPYGPTGGLIYRWAKQIRAGKEIPINRGCTARYNPIYISDCIRYTIDAVCHCSTPARVINIGGADELSELELIAIISDGLGVEPRFRHVGETPLFWICDIGLMKRLFGAPAVTIRDGIANVVQAAPV